MIKTLFVEVVPPVDHSKLKEHEPRSSGVLDTRIVLIHANDNPNGGTVALKVGDEPIEVVDSTTIRRAIRDQDLRIAAPRSSAASDIKRAPSPASGK